MVKYNEQSSDKSYHLTPIFSKPTPTHKHFWEYPWTETGKFNVHFVTLYHALRELRMQSFYLTHLRKIIFLVQMVQKVTEFEFFRT